MKKEITDRINELNGKSNFKDQSLQKNMESISFEKSYLFNYFDEFLTDSICERIKNKDIVLEAEFSYPRINFQKNIFTPFLPDSDDYIEWNELLDEDEVRSVVNTKELDFLFIGETDSFPNYYFISLSDENIDNPTVYTTDHEVFMTEIEAMGTLEDYFNLYCSDVEYKEIINSIANNIATE